MQLPFPHSTRLMYQYYNTIMYQYNVRYIRQCIWIADYKKLSLLCSLSLIQTCLLEIVGSPLGDEQICRLLNTLVTQQKKKVLSPTHYEYNSWTHSRTLGFHVSLGLPVDVMIFFYTVHAIFCPLWCVLNEHLPFLFYISAFNVLHFRNVWL